MLMYYVNLVVSGALLGALYALAAYGMSLYAGVIKVVNIAHGDFAVLAAYIAFFLASSLRINPFLTLIIVAPLMFIVGVLYQRYCINKMLTQSVDAAILTSFAFSIILQNLLLLLFSPDARSIHVPGLIASYRVGDLIISLRYLTCMAVTLIVFAILYTYLKRSWTGMAIRAVPVDREGAMAIGLKTETIYAIAAGIAMLATGIAGFFLGTVFIFYPHTGVDYTLLSLGVVIVGGLGSFRGTIVGGVLLGVLYVLAGHLFGLGLQQAIIYLFILLFLAVRPQGIFGERL